MNSSEPLFSIVIPTRNRSHLLIHSLQSALEQNFDDYEIIVSDNNSSDKTFEIVKQFQNKKVHYFRTPANFSMPDNWEFALSQAKGKYITFLCDDDAISPELLSRISAIISERNPMILNWASAGYFRDSWQNPNERNQLTFSPFTRNIYEFDSKFGLENLFKLRVGKSVLFYHLPLSLNSFCHRDIINRVKSKISRFFLPYCPDYSSAAIMLCETNNYTYIDDILSLSGIGSESIGFSALSNRGDAFKQFVDEFKEHEIFKKTPLKMQCVTNYIAETLLNVKEVFPEKLSAYNLDLYEYLSSCYDGLDIYKKYGLDITKEMNELNNFISKQSFNLKIKIKTHQLKKIVRKLLGNSLLIQNIDILIRPSKRIYKTHATIRGSEQGFNNILECVRNLKNIVNKI